MPLIEGTQLISDAAMFWARDFLIKDNRVPLDDASVVRLNADLDRQMLRGPGRHKFWLHKTTAARSIEGQLPKSDDFNGRVYATLRIDPDNRMISGDLFDDIHRKEWKFSWISDALFTPSEDVTGFPNPVGSWKDDGWDIFCIAKLFPAPEMKFEHQDTPHHIASTIVALALRIGPADDDKHETITGCRMVVSDTTGQVLLDLSRTDGRNVKPRKTFRFFKPQHIISDALSGDLCKLVDEALGKDGAEIGDLLRKTGARIYWDDKFSAHRKPVHVPHSPNDFKMLTPYQWDDDPYSFTLLFTTRHVGMRIFGRVIGLDRKNPMSKARFGAVIYVDTIAEDYQKQIAHEGREYDEAELVDLIRHTYVHELGHLLNIPHSWDRGAFNEPSFPTDPAGISWMNYGSRYPLGNYMKTSRFKDLSVMRAVDSADAEKELAAQDSWRMRQKILRNPGFTTAEQRWIWHAPFDQASPGGPYFTKLEGDPLRFKKEGEVGVKSSAPPRLKLNLNTSREPSSDIYELADFTGEVFRREALFGYVSFETTQKYLDDHAIHFAFQSPMLSLLMRAEYDDAPEWAWTNRTLEVPVPPTPSDWKTDTGSPDIAPSKMPDANINARFHNMATTPSPIIPLAKDALYNRRFLRPLPFIDDRFYERFENPSFDEIPNHFMLQAVLRTEDGKEYRSNIVRIRFEQHKGQYSQPEQEILNHSDLPLVMELLANYPGNIIGQLRKPHQHGRFAGAQEYQEPFKDLLKKIAKLTPGTGGLSSNFFEYLQSIAKGATSTEAELKELHASLPAFLEPYFEHYNRKIPRTPDL